MVELQVALDTQDLDLAIEVATQTAGMCRIEAGTPLLHRHGLRALVALRENLPDATIIADWKTMDCGAVDAALTLEAGADGMIVQAAAPLETIEAAVSMMHEAGGFVMADALGCEDLGATFRKIEGLPIEALVIHTGIDEQAVGIDPFGRFHEAQRLAEGTDLALAGGIAPSNIEALGSAGA